MALCCLLLGSLGPAQAESFPKSKRALALYMKPSATVSSSASSALTQELTAVMNRAGYALDWLGPRPSSAASLVVIELRGACHPPAGPFDPYAEWSGTTLASTQKVNGRILPFVWLNCDALSGFLTAGFGDPRDTNAEFLYGRAMARLLAHELYHFLSQSEDHTSAGLAQAGLNTAELLATSLHFDEEAAASMRGERKSADARQLHASVR